MNLFLDLLPMILGTALAPAWIIIVLLILRSPNGLVKAIAFVVGTTIVRLLQGIVFGSILRSAKLGEGNSSFIAVSMLLLVLGIFLLISAVKKLMNEDDPDAPPPKWMSTFEQATVFSLLGMGALTTLIAPKLWVFTLSALGVIRGENLEPWNEFKIFLLYILAAEILLILPLLLYIAMPRQSAQMLHSVSKWLVKYNKQITVVASLVFGFLFLWKGLSGLLK